MLILKDNSKDGLLIEKFDLKNILYFPVFVSIFYLQILLFGDTVFDTSGLIFQAIYLVIFILFLLLFGIRRSRVEIVFCGDTLDLYHSISDEPVLLFRNIPKTDISRVTLKKRRRLGDQITLFFHNKFEYVVSNQLFNIGSDNQADVLRMLTAQLEHTELTVQ